MERLKIEKQKPLLSNCCGVAVFGEYFNQKGKKQGYCSKCKEPAVFI